MKTIYKLSVILLLCTIIVMGFLGFFTSKSAYQIAVDNGFLGTQEQWIDSLNELNNTSKNTQENNTNTIENNSDLNKNELKSSNLVNMATNKAILSVISLQCEFKVNQNGTYYNAISSGAGVILQHNKENGSGFILTNYHVIYNNSASPQISNNISAYLFGMEYSDYAIDCKYIGGSMDYDIAVLYFENSLVYSKSNAQPVTIANSLEITAGDMAIAIGNPESEGIAATSGIVSVDSENIILNSLDGKNRQVVHRLMRIDTPVNSGNSGGGLFNENAQLIGIVNAKTSSYEIENISYAIPSNVAVGIATNIITRYDGVPITPNRPYLGLNYGATSSSSNYNSITGKSHIEQIVEVYSVEKDSPLVDKLQTGDILTSISVDGITYKINRTFTVEDAIFTANKGSVITISFIRSGVLKSASFIVSKMVSL